MPLTADRQTQLKSPGLKAYPVKAGITIYAGSIVMLDATGFAVPGANTASCVCAGIARARAVGGATDGAVWVQVEAPVIALLAATSITQAMVGRAMYVVDDQTIDDTAANVAAGMLMEFVSTTSGWVLVKGP
jgi:hypothetical protein